MNFAIAFCEHDRDQMARWLAWVEELGGMGRHRLFIMPARGIDAVFNTSIPIEWVNDYFGIKSDWSASNDLVRDAAGANSMLRQFAQHFAMKRLGSWTFIEPDCIPLRAGWHDEWEADYLRGGKPFMGGIVEVPGVPKHSTGNMVLPENAADLYVSLMIPQIADIGGRKVELAFDIAAANDILARHHETKRIQHVFRGPKFEKPEDLARIDPRACLWHSDKDGGLIRLLCCGPASPKFANLHKNSGVAERSNADTWKIGAGRPIDAEAQDTSGRKLTVPTEGSNPSSSPLVHTYFRPCDDPDALGEQKRILAIWERSWREAGFEPVILTEAHARKHPRFEEYRAALEAKPTINPKAYEMACWLRWIAVLSADTLSPLLTDYDVLPFGYVDEKILIASEFPNMLCPGVPCAVVGNKSQFEYAIGAFLKCEPIGTSGMAHLSDMHAAQMLRFPSRDICREYGKPGWKEAQLVHFNHYSCHPRKRSECMEGAAAERQQPSQPMSENSSLSDEIHGYQTKIAEQEKTIAELRKLIRKLSCTPTNGPTAVSSARAAKKSKPLKPPIRRSPEQVEKDRARMAKVRAAKLAKA